MFRKIMAAIAAAIRFVAKTVWVPVRVAGRLALAPLTVLEKVFSGGGGSGDAEEAAADQAAQQAQNTQQAAEQASRSASKATDIRMLATYRARGREISPELWERVQPEVEDYLRALTLEECAQISAQDLKTVAAHMEGTVLISRVRSTEEVGALQARVPAPKPILEGAIPEGVSALRRQIDAALEQARGKKEDAGHVLKA